MPSINCGTFQPEDGSYQLLCRKRKQILCNTCQPAAHEEAVTFACVGMVHCCPIHFVSKFISIAIQMATKYKFRHK